MPEQRTKSSTGGEKGVKLARFDLVPVGPLTELAEHYGVGASKYANHQWRQGYEWSKSYSALMRHLTAFWAGFDYDVCSNDPDGCSHVDLEGNPFVAVREDACFNHTGSHHMAAVAWHSFLLLEFKDSHLGHDDRYVDPRPSVADRGIVGTCGYSVGPVPRLSGQVLVCTREPHGRDIAHTDGSAFWGERVEDEDSVWTVGKGRIRETYDMPEPEEPLHGFSYVGERAEDLVEAEESIGSYVSRWLKDYDAELADGYGFRMLRNFPRVNTGLTTLAEATKFDQFFNGQNLAPYQGVISREVERLVRAADEAVERRLREQFGPDLLSKRAHPRVDIDYDDGHSARG